MLSLVRFDRIAEEGSTEPPIFEVDDGNYYVVKGGNAVMPDHAAELLTARLAPLFGVVTPPAETLHVGPGLVEVAREAQMDGLARLLSSGRGVVFGSRLLPEARVLEYSHLQSDERRAQVLRMLALDLFVGNRDRRTKHPNTLYVNHSLVGIDHAQAFPWLAGDAVDLQGIFDEHLGTPYLDSGAYTREQLASVVGRLNGPDILRAIADLPEVWWPRAMQAHRLLDILMDQRDAVARFILRAKPR